MQRPSVFSFYFLMDYHPHPPSSPKKNLKKKNENCELAKLIFIFFFFANNQAMKCKHIIWNCQQTACRNALAHQLTHQASSIPQGLHSHTAYIADLGLCINHIWITPPLPHASLPPCTPTHLLSSPTCPPPPHQKNNWASLSKTHIHFINHLCYAIHYWLDHSCLLASYS